MDSADDIVARRMPEPEDRYVLRQEVAIEDFDDGSLVLLCEQLQLVELNLVARDIVGRLDGTRSLGIVAQEVAQAHGAPFEQVLEDVRELFADLEGQGVVERFEEQERKEDSVKQSKRYMVNPDVSCREEGPDGALLFNPDTDALMAVNPTGLLIWQSLREPRTAEEVVAHLVEACEDVPLGEVAADVEAFLFQVLQPQGFVGEVSDPVGD